MMPIHLIAHIPIQTVIQSKQSNIISNLTFPVIQLKSFTNTFTDCLDIATSRIINPMETNPIYPWMAFLMRQERKKPYKQEDSIPEACTGAVLSRR